MKTQDAIEHIRLALADQNSPPPAEAIAALLTNTLGDLARIADALEKIAGHLESEERISGDIPPASL